MTRQDIDSSMLRSIGYDPETQTLEAEYKRGDLWQYSPVEASVYAMLLDPTASAGKILNAQVLHNPAITQTKVER